MIKAQELRDIIDDEVIEEVSKRAYSNSLDLATRGGPWEDVGEYGKKRTIQMVTDVLTELVTVIEEKE